MDGWVAEAWSTIVMHPLVSPNRGASWAALSRERHPGHLPCCSRTAECPHRCPSHYLFLKAILAKEASWQCPHSVATSSTWPRAAAVLQVGVSSVCVSPAGTQARFLSCTSSLLLHRDHGECPQLPERSLQQRRSSTVETSPFRVCYAEAVLTVLGNVLALTWDVKPSVSFWWSESEQRGEELFNSIYEGRGLWVPGGPVASMIEERRV